MFLACLGDDEFTAEVLFYRMLVDHLNGHHSTDLIMVDNTAAPAGKCRDDRSI